MKLNLGFSKMFAQLFAAQMASRMREFRVLRSYSLFKNQPTPKKLRRGRYVGEPPRTPTTARMMFKANNRGFKQL